MYVINVLFVSSFGLTPSASPNTIVLKLESLSSPNQDHYSLYTSENQCVIFFFLDLLEKWLCSIREKKSIASLSRKDKNC